MSIFVLYQMLNPALFKIMKNWKYPKALKNDQKVWGTSLFGHQKDIHKNLEWLGNVLMILSAKKKKQNANLMTYYDLSFI